MESQKTTQNTEERSGDGFGAAIFVGAILCLAGIGLYNVLKKDNEGRKSIAGRRESELLDELSRKDVL